MADVKFGSLRIKVNSLHIFFRRPNKNLNTKAIVCVWCKFTVHSKTGSNHSKIIAVDYSDLLQVSPPIQFNRFQWAPKGNQLCAGNHNIKCSAER